MDRIEIAAQVVHEANRRYSESLGEEAFSWDEAPQWQRDSAIDGVKLVSKRRVINPDEQHEAWARKKKAEGWVWGPVKDETLKTHPCLVPFRELSVAQQAKDTLFINVARAVLGSLGHVWS